MQKRVCSALNNGPLRILQGRRQAAKLSFVHNHVLTYEKTW